MSDIADTITHDIVSALEDDELALPMLPEVALQVRQAVDDEDIGAAELGAVVQQDPGLAARLIRVANSPMLRGNQPIDDLGSAIGRLGLAFTANLATGFAMQNMFQSTNDLVDKSLRDTWAHAIEVAAVATVLCRHFTPLRADLAMLGGLTHSIGTLPVLAWLEHHPSRILDVLTLERVLAGIQGELGCMILKEWAFPSSLCALPTEHLNFSRNSPCVDYTDVVMVANLHTRAGSDHPLAKTNWQHISAFHKLGLEQQIDSAEASEAVAPELLDNSQLDELDSTRGAFA